MDLTHDCKFQTHADRVPHAEGTQEENLESKMCPVCSHTFVF